MAKRTTEESAIADYLQQGAAALRLRRETTLSRSHAMIAFREQLFLQELQQALRQVLGHGLRVGSYKPPRRSPKRKQRQINLILSDLHFHSLLNAKECVSAYGPREEARRLASVLVQTADYKPQYRAETDLNVHLLGDVIQNQLYDQRDGAPLAQQCAAAIHLLTQAFLYLGTEFGRVRVRCNPGNHGRFKSRHLDRAVNQKWDAIETVIYFAVKAALKAAGAVNVSVEIPQTPFYTWKAFDRYGFATHGDTVFNPGNPAKMLNVSEIRKQINSINAGLGLKSREIYSLFICGHVHFGAALWPPGQASFISNGALIPTDQYGLSIGETNTRTGQVLWESVAGHILGDLRFLEVNEATDRDRALDRVIKPFSAF